jgi:hypothetical protein
MRFIKLAIISFIVLALIITGMSLFFPSHIRLSKAINIKANQDSILAQIRDAGNWKNWFPGTDTAKLYFENGQARGIILDDRDSSRPVYLHITGETNDEVIAEMVTNKMKPVVNGWKTISYPSGDSTTVQWYMDFHLRWYPWEKFRSLILERSYGPKMEKGLSNLRTLLQSK